MGPSDSVLWSRSRAGDAEAFGSLFDRHAKAIYNYCFRRIGDWAAAEDMLSVVFLEAWRRRDNELPPDKVLPWLYGSRPTSSATAVVAAALRGALNRMPTIEPKPDFAGGRR